MKFTVIIPTYNDWERLQTCVINIMQSPLVPGKDYEIIVVDNAITHDPPESLRNLDGLSLIHEKIPGSYAARNSGAKKATGKYLAFTDSDCVPCKNWLKNAHAVFSEQQCDLIGGRIDLFRVDNSSRWAYVYEKHTAFSQAKNVPKGHSVTANLLVKREVFEELDGFNAKIKSGGDWEFSSRAVKAGYHLVYADDVKVKHPARSTIRAIFKKQKRFAAWGYINVQREYGHSGIRILLSQCRNIGSITRNVKKPEHLNEKSIVFMISSGLYFYRLFLYTLILLRIMNPVQIRE